MPSPAFQAAEPTPTFAVPVDAQWADEGTAKIVETATLVRLWADPPTLDPHLTTDATSGTIILEVFGGLVTMDHDLEIVLDLAETWDVSPGGDIYTFRLRRDGRFHDGKPVTAHDFKWSLERAADPATFSLVADTYLGDIIGVRQKLNGEADEIEGVLAVDEHTLQITLDSPKTYFLSKLTYPTAFVLDRENVESSDRWFLSPNGTGPFKLAKYVPGQVLDLSRNETYHLGAPRLKGVRFLLGGGDPLSMYSNDEIHILELGAAGPEPILDPSHSLRGDLRLTPPRFTVTYIGMNVGQPPFEDPRVRQACSHAIDRDWISNALFDGALQPAKSILPPGFPGHRPWTDRVRIRP